MCLILGDRQQCVDGEVLLVSMVCGEDYGRWKMEYQSALEC